MLIFYLTLFVFELFEHNYYIFRCFYEYLLDIKI
jgi:hypothetical protein